MNTHRNWKWRAPAYSLNDAPVAFRRSPQMYSVNSVESPCKVSLRFEGSPLDPRLFFVPGRAGGAAGVFATHIADILGCGTPDILLGARRFLELTCGKLEVQEKSFVPGRGAAPGGRFLGDSDPGGLRGKLGI